ncbi:MAG TPA: MBL fold metallo-hydrolase [Spirochaetota bacterium]|nr:MBL fold metallo-hydrolase [Spirochaetota bacterium]HPJ36413.1 MBL fold metallo-hydrolase [Spirochaetota bacterium]
MKVKLWGVRGSIPTPLSSDTIEQKLVKALTFARPGDISSEEAVKSFVDTLPLYIKGTYGGNTTCIEVLTDSGELIIIDCGSGLMHLGRTLMTGDFGKGTGVANIFLTHTHWDHIQGIPFFTPFYIKGNRFNFYSPMDDLKERIDYQQAETHFPVTFDNMQASKRFFKVNADEEFYINDVKIYTKSMPHPGGAFGIRVEEGDKVFVYTSDCEFSINEIDNIQSYEPLFNSANVALFDAQYTFHESLIDKITWGHSSATIAIDIADKYDIQKLVLFHHDPTYDDEKLNSVISNARTYINVNKKIRDDLEVELATEGMVFEF